MRVRLHTAALAIVAVATLVPGAPSPAKACGGFFCNAVTLSPIYQAGERVLFASEEGMTTMHIEVTYAGDPTQFGWILPLPDVPRDANGDPLPLEKAVGISSPTLFQILQNQTDPQFIINNTGTSGSCGNGRATSAAGGFAMDAGAAGAPNAAPEEPEVQVLDEAKVGPYDAQLIQTESSDALFEWLNDNEYYQDPAAKPLLGHYVSQGYVFVGIRLQSGKDNGDIKPLSLHFGENAPCVPLRLTKIAATEDMPILVWVLGEGRAVPKNFLHAIVDDRAVQFPGGTNYFDVVTEAIDTASGHAWVTEFAGDASQFRGMFLPDNWKSLDQVDAASDLRAMLTALQNNGMYWNADVVDVLRDEVAKPAGLKGYLYGSCWNSPDWDGTGECNNDTHETSDDEFYMDLMYWLDEAKRQELTIEADLEGIRAGIKERVIGPLEDIESLFARSKTLTRFFTTSDPEEMTKDPVFAYNPELPDVSLTHTVDVHQVSTPDCDPFTIATYADGNKYTFEGFSVGTVPGVSPLKVVELLDEEGPARPFHPDQAHEVDTILNNAVVGSPSLPANFELKPAPVEAPSWPNPPPGWGDDGCSGGAAGSSAWLLSLLALALLAFRRRAA